MVIVPGFQLHLHDCGIHSSQYSHHLIALHSLLWPIVTHESWLGILNQKRPTIFIDISSFCTTWNNLSWLHRSPSAAPQITHDLLPVPIPCSYGYVSWPWPPTYLETMLQGMHMRAAARFSIPSQYIIDNVVRTSKYGQQNIKLWLIN